MWETHRATSEPTFPPISTCSVHAMVASERSKHAHGDETWISGQLGEACNIRTPGSVHVDWRVARSRMTFVLETGTRRRGAVQINTGAVSGIWETSETRYATVRVRIAASTCRSVTPATRTVSSRSRRCVCAVRESPYRKLMFNPDDWKCACSYSGTSRRRRQRRRRRAPEVRRSRV